MARAPLQDGDPAQVGRYRLIGRLGAGGMGVVYLATAQDGARVAVKVLQPGLAGDQEFRRRFGREVAALVRVRGVCTVRVIEADTTSARPFLVTEYAEGPSLAEYIEARGPLDPQMLYGLAAGLAEALTAIHGAGIVHRDLKPSNVLLTASGPKVIDFGIAQALDATSALTRTGMTIGSAGYIAPEQIMGRAGTASDIFSWAVTIAYAASGQPPFGSGTSDVILYRILHETPDIAAVPATLLPYVTAALAKEPQGRPTAPMLLSQLTRTVAQPSADVGNPTQTLLAQTWRPPTSPTDFPATRSSAPTPAATRPSAPTPAATRPSSGPYGPTPPDPYGPTPDDPYGPGAKRSRLRRPALLVIVLAVAIVLGGGGAALALALSGHHASPGTNPGQSQTAPVTPTVTSNPASTSPPASRSSSSPSQSTSASASSSASASTSASASSSSSTSSTSSASSTASATPVATGG